MSTKGATQRKTEWFVDLNERYYDRQFEEPYRSTVAFCEWLERKSLLSKHRRQRILDVGTGKGANILYMGKRYSRSEFVGLDINPRLIAERNVVLRRNLIRNCSLIRGDLYRLRKSEVGHIDGVVSYQTLSWLPDYRKPLAGICRLGPRWIAATSLFYEGLVNARIEVEEFSKGLGGRVKKCYYNIYSLPILKEFLHHHGYQRVFFTPFEIDIDLPRPRSRLMSTYTENLIGGRRQQISGPLLMSWYFVAAVRNDSQ